MCRCDRRVSASRAGRLAPPLQSSGERVYIVCLSVVSMGVALLTNRARAPGADMRHLAFDVHQEGGFPVCFFLALRRGEPVGAALGSLLEAGINLSGGAVVPHARGVGVYTALVHARWAAAVQRNTPALTVQAGKMSRPILERLGFTPLATSINLCDDFA